jgi:ATP synthase I chain
MTETPLPSPDPAFHEIVHARYSRRILAFTLIFGFAAAIVLAFVKSGRWGIGIAVGTALAWLNYLWLDQALGGLVASATAQEGAPKPVVPFSLYAKFIGRYLLIGITLYVIVVFFRVPILACLVGLLALGSGTIAAALYDVFSGNN